MTTELNKDFTGLCSGAALLQTNNPLAPALNRLIADSFALYVKTKSYHWHVSGPQFRSYHMLFDSQAAQILAAIDPMAERLRKIGERTIASVSDILGLSMIASADSTALTAEEMAAHLKADNEHILDELRRLRRIADTVGDNALGSLIDQWTDEAEGRIWFLSETLLRLNR